jgi:hypothetical protein
MKKRNENKPQEQLQFPLNNDIQFDERPIHNNAQQGAKIVDIKSYQQKAFIGFILKNTKPF